MIRVTSSAFAFESTIPRRFSCEGENINPPLSVQGIPAAAKSLTLTVSDPDAPTQNFTHWLVWNIPPQTDQINPGNLPHGAVTGTNDSGQNGYLGPCPPSGTHRYYFKFAALDSLLNLPVSSTRPDLEKAMAGHIIDQGELIGTYTRQ